MKKVFMGAILSLLAVGFAFAAKGSFKDITPQELRQMLGGRKDFALIDVHIPEQKHIQGTDDFIPYNAISENKDKLPPKDTKIVVYCRTSSMSAQAAQELLDMGYTEVYNLKGGIVLWKEAGFKVTGADKIIYLKAKRFAFSPDTIKVKQANKVKIITQSLDVAHSFALSDFGVDEHIKPGKKSVIEFVADKSGEYTFRCSVYCGTGHAGMKGKLIVE
jgi:heme/copper-type cytochrome/quinol oxidase subunit 2